MESEESRGMVASLGGIDCTGHDLRQKDKGGSPRLADSWSGNCGRQIWFGSVRVLNNAANLDNNRYCSYRLSSKRFFY